MARDEEIGVGLVFVAPDPAPQLIEIAQAESVRAINNDGIGVRNIQTALNYGSGEEHVCLAIDKARHDLFQVITVHLSVADHDPRFGQERAQPDRHRVDVKDAVVEVKALAKLSRNSYGSRVPAHAPEC